LQGKHKAQLEETARAAKSLLQSHEQSVIRRARIFSLHLLCYSHGTTC
jgi:hypothetical protein